MAQNIDANNFTLDDHDLPVLRQELEVTEQIYDGQRYFVIKDPLSLKYYRFNREEYFVLDLLRQPSTVESVKQAYLNEFNSDDLDNQEIGLFVSDLLKKNLVMAHQPHRDQLLYDARQNAWKSKFKKQIFNFMFFRIPLFDPDKILDKMHARMSWLWSKPFILFYILLIIVAIGLVADKASEFSVMFKSNFFTIYNIPILFAVIWIIKGFHEFGHGLMCKHYGGEVHEMGYLCLVFMPFFYCNVTDSWTFTNKRHRFLVTAGGIMTEVFFAAVAAIVWYFTSAPSFIHTIAFNVMVACSISTILFNANPLLRYDGYYMLMDLIEVPNLRQRASRYMTGIFVRYVMGGYAEEMREEHRYRFMFPIFSVAAVAYRWFIMIMILYLLYNYLSQVRLEWVGTLLVVFCALTMLLIPTYKMGDMIIKKRQVYGITNVRLMVLLAGIVTLLGVVMFWPMKQHVVLNFVLEPHQKSYIRSEVGGVLNWKDDISEGHWVDPETNDGLAVELSNGRLAYEKVRLTESVKQAMIDKRVMRQSGVSSNVMKIDDYLEKLQRDQQRLDEMMAALKIKVPFKAQVFTDELQLRQMEKQFQPQGAPLLFLADPTRLEAKVWVPEKTYTRIFKQSDQLGQNAELMLYAFPADRFSGQVVEVSPHQQEDMGEFGEKMALSNKVGGEVLTEYDPITQQEKPVETAYEVTIQLDPETLVSSARSYMSGRVRIDCGKSTLFQWGRDSLLRFISADVRL